MTVTADAGFALGLGFGAACAAVRPNRVAAASAAASVRVFIRPLPCIAPRRDLTLHRVNHLLKRIGSGLLISRLLAAIRSRGWAHCSPRPMHGNAAAIAGPMLGSF